MSGSKREEPEFSVPNSDDDVSGDDDEQLYEVERILAERPFDGGPEVDYLTMWKGYVRPRRQQARHAGLDCFPPSLKLTMSKCDDEATWEPSEHFANSRTIEEWKEALANGDTLTAEEVAALQVRMDGKAAELARQKEAKKKEKMNKRRKKQFEETISVRTPASPRKHSERKGIARPVSKNRESPIRRDPPAKAKPAPQATTVGTMKPVLLQESQSPVAKFHAIEKSKNDRRSSPPAADKLSRAKHTGDKFRNLRHMNNAQKKSRKESHPEAHLKLRPVEEIEYREPAHNLPSARHRDDSPMFFPETAGVTRDDKALAPSHELSSLFSSVAEGPMSPIQSKVQLAPETYPPKIVAKYTRRSFGPGEVLVRLQFGDHEVGDVLLLHLPGWLKATIVKLKVEHLLLLRFEQSLVFNHEDFAQLSRPWPPESAGDGAVNPYDDTRTAVEDLGRYLAEHDVAAVWEHPNVTDTVGLVLYSPQARSWRRYCNDPRLQKFPLVIMARNRTYRGQVPVPLGPVKADAAANQSSFLPPLPPVLDDPLVSTMMPLTQHPADVELRQQEQTMQHPSIVAFGPQVSTDPRKRTILARRESIDLQEDLRSHQKVLHEIESLDTLVEDASHLDSLDWTVRADFTSLTSAKAFVYIAFSEEFPTQANALKTWAKEHTSFRFVMTDADGADDWETLKSNKTAAMLLFHGDNPKYCMLKEMYSVLGRDGSVSCYNVAWDTTSTSGKMYSFSRLFPRGTVLLITESTIINHTKEAVFALQWFKLHSKSKYWKIMTRPNVRAWLQQTALECEDEEKAKALFEVLRMLFKLNPTADVTIGGTADSAAFLDFEPAQQAATNSFIVPLAELPGYDESPSADGSAEAMALRDEALRNHFIYWSVLNAASSRRFIALDDIQTRNGKASTRPDGAEHIRFWKPDIFMRDNMEKGEKGEKAKPA